MAILRYEERVRIERANGLREPDKQCGDNLHTCTPYSDTEYAGKSFSDVASQPLRQNMLCPHPKVIVPVTPAFVVEEPVKTITVAYPEGKYQLVDFNECDGRIIGALQTMSDTHHNQEVDHANTEVTLKEVVIDTPYDKPNKVRSIKQTVKKKATIAQPLATGATTADPVPLSKIDDGAEQH